LKEKVSKKNFDSLLGLVVDQADATATWNCLVGEWSVLLQVKASKKDFDSLPGPVIDRASAAAT